MTQSTETERNGAPVGFSNTRRYNVRTAAMFGIVMVAIFAGVAAAYSTTLPTTLAAPNQGNASPMQVNVTASASQSVSIIATATMPPTQTQQLQTQTSMSMTTAQASTSVSPATTIQTSTSVTVSLTAASTVTTHTMTTTSLPAQYCGYGCYYNYPYPPYYSGYPGYYYYGGSYPGYYNGVPAFASAYACANGIGYSNNVQCTGYIYQAPNGCVELVVQVVNPYSYTSALQYYTLHNLSTTPPSGTLVTVTGQLYRGYNTSSLGASCPGNYINVTSISTA